MKEKILIHEGVKRRSGRFPWGSGQYPYQHEPWFEWSLKGRAGGKDPQNEPLMVWSLKDKEYRQNGLSEKDIAQSMGITVETLRQMRSLVKEEKIALDSAHAWALKQHGYSNVAIAEKMDIGESRVRWLLKRHEEVRENTIRNVADKLKSQVSERKYLDVGAGTELYLDVSETRKNTALYLLEQEGYNVHKIKVEQQNNPGHYTTMLVLTPPGVERSEVNKHRERIHILDEHSTDGGKTFLGIEPPVSIDSKRIKVLYSEEGGKDKDGVIELRRGVEDLTMGDSKYAQVRIAVDGTHFLKGMALYSDNIPEGYDIVFNTNKPKGTPLKSDSKEVETVFKMMKNDPDNPFGAVIKEQTGQRHYISKDGESKLSAINIVNEEGDWKEWKKSIASQMLSKQELTVAKEQLNIAYAQKQAEFDEIMALTNPVVKKRLLYSFADDCDAAAVHLKAAAFPRQASRVILPLTDIKDNEIYAPGFKSGDRVVLIRYPHGGRFEIPELIVNNKNRDGIRTIGNKSQDAVGINSSVAKKLSGADFDGDTVLIIPNNTGRIKISPTLAGLKNFDPSESYPAYPGMPKVTKDNFDTQIEMGKISNLITDMTLKGANQDELARAVKHSMVVIDAEKHNLDYKTSYIDNRIAELKEEYQGSKKAGASTLISKASSPQYIPERATRTAIDKETGEKLYFETGREYYSKKTGKTETYKTEVPLLSLKKDAHEISSGTAMENAYADYSNSMKAMANQARLNYISIKTEKKNASAEKTYAKEVESINAKLYMALKNAPVSRKAQLVASTVVAAKVKDNPELRDRDHKKELNKIRSQALAAANARYGASRKENIISLTPREWEAIQAGAISPSKLSTILEYTDLDVIKQYATPRTAPVMSPAMITAARAMLDSGYTQEDVAEKFNISVTTLVKNVLE